MTLSKLTLSIIFSYFIVYLSLYTIAFYNIQFYKTEFKKYNVYNKFPHHNIDSINASVIAYLKGEAVRLDPSTRSGRTGINEFFNTKEIQHLRDVRDVFILFNKIFKILLFIALILLLINYQNITRLLLSSIFTGSLITIGLICLLGILILCDFDSAFIHMHNIFFKPGTWVFEFNDNIVNLYVEDFFYDIAIYLVKTIVLVSIFLALTSKSISRSVRLDGASKTSE